MSLLGTLIFIFILIHLRGFWFEFKFGDQVQWTEIEGVTMHNAYIWVADAYANPLISTFYIISMMVLGFHLWHGFASAFQSLGLNHSKYNGLISILGKLYAIAIPALYALIPILLYLKSLS